MFSLKMLKKGVIELLNRRIVQEIHDFSNRLVLINNINKLLKFNEKVYSYSS